LLPGLQNRLPIILSMHCFEHPARNPSPGPW
jgi:hypothetical protein